MMRSVRLGTTYLGNGQSDIAIWAPLADTVELTILEPKRRSIPLSRESDGYHFGRQVPLEPGSRYLVRLDTGDEYPDPASRSQPEGVHGPSEVLDPAFSWNDKTWIGIPLDRYLVYELHVGTYSEEGTFAGLIPHLNGLKDLGVTAVELMPVAQFPGERNWGYDGVGLFAVQNSYGGPAGLKHLIDACHGAGLAVVLDVVYNHLGPEGNYLSKFGPYFTDRYKTPWGLALNFDGPDSDHVRRFFIENALYWIRDFHVDALRLDAVHAITDFSAKTFLAELAEAVRGEAHRLGRRIYLIAESDLNDPRLIRPPEIGGFGLDAQWSDDFHHALHATLTGEQSGYYEDFGDVQAIARAFANGYVYTGQYSPFRRRRHGVPVSDVPADRFVVCAQNHDQVGNRARGERLNTIAGIEALKVATAAVILSPFIPLLFMGQEYGEVAPFLYFVDHSDPDLIRAVREGRKAEFSGFDWDREPPDAAHPDAFAASKLDHDSKQTHPHNALLAFTRALIAIRKNDPAYDGLSKENWRIEHDAPTDVIVIRSVTPLALIFNFNTTGRSLRPHTAGSPWRLFLDSAAERWGGPGGAAPRVWSENSNDELRMAPHSVAIYQRDEEAA